MAYKLDEIRRIRERLPEWTKDAIVAAHDGGMSWRQVADTLGMKSIRGVRLLAGAATQSRWSTAGRDVSDLLAEREANTAWMNHLDETEDAAELKKLRQRNTAIGTRVAQINRENGARDGNTDRPAAG